MISELIFQKIVDFIVAHKRSIITFGSITLVILIVVKIFSSYAFINISVSSVLDASSTPITLLSSTDTTSDNIGKPGLKLVSRSIKNITASQGNYIRTQATVDIPWFGYVQKKISLIRDKNAKKIAYTNDFTDACSTYSPRLNNLLSFNCNTPVSLTNKRDDNSDTITKFQFINSKGSPYMGGVIGFTPTTVEHVDGAVLIIDDAGRINSYATPKELNKTALQNTKIFTNTANPDDSRFIIVDNTGTVYLGVPNTETREVLYTQYKAPSTYKENSGQTICAFANADDVYCYRGPTPVDDTQKQDTKFEESITKLSFTSNKASVTQIKDSRSDLTDFYVTTNGELYGNYSRSLMQFSLTKNTYVHKPIAGQVTTAAAGSSLIYVQNGGVYTYKQNTATQIFYSENIRPSKLYVTREKTFVIGSIANTQTSQYAYLINDEDDIAPGHRIIDLLPTKSTNLPMVSSQELIGDHLFLTLKVVYNKKARTYSSLVDPAVLGQAQENTRNALTSRGINLDNITISYSY